MKVYLEAAPHLSKAMFRVADALRETAPLKVQVVDEPEEAELEILHAIDDRPERRAPAAEHAVIQYCRYTSKTESNWGALWGTARAVWSYYDLEVPHTTRFYHAPLGVDPKVFTLPTTDRPRVIGVVTSGYVSGPQAEAIEEVAEAARQLCLPVFHLGPQRVEGMRKRRELSWKSGTGLTDVKLADAYRTSRWVSGLRHVEGFELPVLEGLACGARPIVFDRPDMRRWYDGHAVFVPECSGYELVRQLVDVMAHAPDPVTKEERAEIVDAFDWEAVAEGFWETVL